MTDWARRAPTALWVLFVVLLTVRVAIGQSSRTQSPYEGNYSGTFQFSNGSSGTLSLVVDANGRVTGQFDNKRLGYSYDCEGSIDPQGRMTSKVIFQGRDWGKHQGRLAKLPGGKLKGQLDEFPNGKPATGRYSVELARVAADTARTVPARTVPARPVPARTVPARTNAGNSAPVTYKVTMTTSLVIPDGNELIEQIRVYHALPTWKRWSQSKNGHGASSVSFTPETAELTRHDPTDSHHLLWTVDGKARPGRRMTWVTRMTIASIDRTLDPRMASVRWEEYQRSPDDSTAIVDPETSRNIHPEMARVAAAIKQSQSPAEAVPAMCKWIVDNIKYDASVRHATTDIGGILSNRCGHCGHQATVLRQLTASLGIPYRPAFGMNLYAPDGRTSKLQEVRADYTNIHTWAEVYFPGVGWVEVDPALGERAFLLPAHLIQCNRWFQNYSIWLREAGVDKQPTWTPVKGGFRSDYGVEHIISYAKQ